MTSAASILAAAFLGGGCSSAPAGDSDGVGSNAAALQINAGSSDGYSPYSWTMFAGDGLPSDGAVVSRAARQKRMWGGQSVVPATGTLCTMGIPYWAGGCSAAGVNPAYSGTLLSIDANDQLASLGAPWQQPGQAFDFTGEGVGEAFWARLEDLPVNNPPSPCFPPTAFPGGTIYANIEADECNFGLFDNTPLNETVYWSTLEFSFPGGLWPELWNDPVYGDFNDDGAIDLLAWNGSSSPASAAFDHQMRLVTFKGGPPQLVATAAEGLGILGNGVSWQVTASDTPLAAGNFLASAGSPYGAGDEVLVQNTSGFGVIGYTSGAFTTEWTQAFGAKIGPLTTSITTKAKSIGDVTGDGIDDLLFSDSAQPGTLVVASMSVSVGERVTIIDRRVFKIPVYSTALVVDAVLTAGSTLPSATAGAPAWTLAPAANGVLDMVGAYMDGTGVANLVYSGPSGIMVAKYSSAISGFHVIASAAPGVRVGGWVVGAQSLGIPIRRTNGTDGVFVTSTWGIGLFTLVGGALANPWLGPYSTYPTPTP